MTSVCDKMYLDLMIFCDECLDDVVIVKSKRMCYNMFIFIKYCYILCAHEDEHTGALFLWM